MMGDMMWSVRISAMPVMTIVGGIWGVPIAWRMMPPTMTIFAKDVTSVNRKGASERNASATTHEVIDGLGAGGLLCAIDEC